MDQKMCLKDNVYIVNSIAEARFYEGNDTAALTGFQRVRLTIEMLNDCHQHYK